MDFQSIRKEYENRGIAAGDCHRDPMKQFQQWLEAAVEFRPGDWLEPNAVTLATCDLNGRVTARMVLLKDYGCKAFRQDGAGNETGFVFFANYSSSKGIQLAANPNASLLFHWPYLGRQIRIEGDVDRTTRAISENYFRTRPRGAQIGAAASFQSEVISTRDQLVAHAKQISGQFENREIPCPENWGGYVLFPEQFEFWQGRADRLHDRLRYRRGDDELWMIERLSP